MNTELLNKFNSTINYYSDYKSNENGGLKRLVFKTLFNVEPNGIIRMDIWILVSDFYDIYSKPKIIYQHQTVFELKKGQQLNENEFIEMFRFTEEDFLNTEIQFDNNHPQKIKDILGLDNNKIPKEEIIELVKDGPSSISKLWK